MVTPAIAKDGALHDLPGKEKEVESKGSKRKDCK